MARTRPWVDLLPVIEFAVNSTPNRMTGYTGFYLNYGFHPLHPLQLLDSPEHTNVESVVSFTSRLQGDFTVAKEQLHRAQQQMKQMADQHRRAVDYAEGDQVLLNTRYFEISKLPKKIAKAFRRTIYHRAENRQSSVQTPTADDLDCSSCLPYIIVASLEIITMELPRGHPCS